MKPLNKTILLKVFIVWTLGAKGSLLLSAGGSFSHQRNKSSGEARHLIPPFFRRLVNCQIRLVYKPLVNCNLILSYLLFLILRRLMGRLWISPDQTRGSGVDSSFEELPGINFRRSARMTCSPFTSSVGNGQGRTGNMYRKGLAPNSYRFLIKKNSSWLRSLSMISSSQVMRSSLSFST